MTGKLSVVPTWEIAGPVWLSDYGDLIELRHENGFRCKVAGAVGTAIRTRSLDEPHLRALAKLEPRMQLVIDSLESHASRPLTRADVMRGTGYELLFIELTSQCNERCSHCYADAGPERSTALSWTSIERAIDDAAELGFRIVQLTGGDPLIHPDVVRAVAHARARAIPIVELYTNGLALTRELLGELFPFKPCFAFSVYSHDAAIHDSITNVVGSHARTMRAIVNCVELGLTVRTGVTLFEPNHQHKAAILNSLQRLGLERSQIAFNTSHAVGRGDFFDGPERDAHHGSGSQGGGKACIAPNGDVHPCIFARNLRLGNVGTQSLSQILTAQLPIQTAQSVDDAAARAGRRLSCTDCQLRDALLDSDSSSSPDSLVPLRRKLA